MNTFVRRASLAIVVGIAFSVPLAGLTTPAAALAPGGREDFEFDSYSADFFLGIDEAGHSTLRTVETLVAVFPEFDQNRGIIRAIPNYYDGIPLETIVVSVVDENSVAVPFEIVAAAEFTEVALGTDEFVHGRTTYVITYLQRNVVRSFADVDADEFYWDANGTGWPQPFGSADATVHVPPELIEVLTGEFACYRGGFGDTEPCTIERSDDALGVRFAANAGPLEAFETLTVAVGFERGTFVHADPVPVPGGGDEEYPSPFPIVSPVAAWWIDAGSYASVALIVLGTVFTVVWRFVRPKGSKGSGIIIPQYTVPKNLSVLEAAELIGRRRYGVAAQIVSLAVRGNLRILDYPVTGSGARYSLQLLNIDRLSSHELSLVTALFGGTEIGAVREVGVVDDAAATAVGRVGAAARESVLARGLLQKRSSALGVIAAVVMFVMSFATMGLFMLSVFAGHFNPWGIIGFILAMVSIFVCLGFAYRPAVPTASGVVHEEYLLGIRDYLQLAEADRFRMLQSPEGAERVRAEGLDPRFPAQRVKLYERLLPFAVLWGVEREWAKELTVLYGDSPPEWFVSAGSFDSTSFSVALGSIAVSPVVTRSASTSSGSSWSGSGGGSFSGGSSGGGFSGGGGGGGGGGGR